MASEIRVNKIENRSGLGTVTFADTGVDLAGIVTATTFSGSGASLTNVPDSALSAVTASKLSGALPAISAASLTNVPAANVVGVHTSLTVTNATTTGTAVVGGGVTISESGIEASGIGITVASINGGAVSGRRNLIINGAMLVAQRGTSSTTNGYGSLDRFMCTHEGTDEAVTHAQVDVSSGTTPYSLGFRKAMKLTNGNQTGGAGGNDNVGISQAIEAQNIASSGWNYTSSSSFITLSFWVKSSVAQNFYGYLYINDGTAQLYSFETGSLTADTWTKIIKKVPGNSNITINNDTGFGMQLQLWTFLGTNYTGTTTLNQWANYSSSTRIPDMTTTWYTTNDSTFEMTGVQIEVGPEATSFEHRSFGEELSLCQRYCYVTNEGGCGVGVGGGSNAVHRCQMNLPVTMRAAPTVTMNGSTMYTYDGANSAYFNGFAAVHSTNQAIDWEANDSERTAGSVVAYRPVIAYINSNSGGVICTAEL